MNIDITRLDYYDNKLKYVLNWLQSSTGLAFTITSQWRENDSGVHGTIPLRGTDLRCTSFYVGKALEKYINEYWRYDPSRPEKKVAIYHKVSGSGWHLHIQVHPNTKLRR